MALFRLITGEEEAATAIFRSLQRLRYPDADRLRWREHTYKAALLPFIEAVTSVIRRAQGELGIRLTAEVEREPSERVFVRMYMQSQVIEPLPPLGVGISAEGQGSYDFRSELREVLRQKTSAQVASAVRARGNFRNRLLYATPNGMPKIEGEESVWFTFRERIYSLLLVYLLVDQTAEHQLLVLQLLPTFLELVAEARQVKLGPAESSNFFR